MPSITPHDWLTWLLAQVVPLPQETRRVADAGDMTLASDVYTEHSLPLWDNSAMDGYAVHAADIAHAAASDPVVLCVVGEVAAGSALDPEIKPGHAVRIMTGAPVPSSADTVIPVELTAGDDGEATWAQETVHILSPVPLGANIRRAGEDISFGDVIAVAGSRLAPARLAALAAAGIERVSVHRMPKVAVLVTGSELRAPGAVLHRGQIPESNSVLISGLLRELGITSARIMHSSDDAHQLKEELRALGEEFDVVVTTGGVGPGRHDVVRIALEDEAAVRAVRVAIRPGQTQSAGRLRSGAMIFALPGNPVSAAVSFELFVRPALLAMQGRSDLHRLRVSARVRTGWRGKPGRTRVLPVTVSAEDGVLWCEPAVNPTGISHAVGSYGNSEGYAIVEGNTAEVNAGDTVVVLLQET